MVSYWSTIAYQKANIYQYRRYCFVVVINPIQKKIYFLKVKYFLDC
jgi:hypothetical protein